MTVYLWLCLIPLALCALVVWCALVVGAAADE